MQTTTPPLARNVLHPELRKLVDTNELDFTQMTQRMYATPITNGTMSTLSSSIKSGSFYNLNASTANPVYVDALVGAYLLMSNSNAESVVTAISMAGSYIATIQIGAIIGTAPNTSTWTAAMGKKAFSVSQTVEFAAGLVQMYNQIYDRFPLHANTIDEADTICLNMVSELFKSGMFSNSDILKATYFLAIKPYVRLVFVGSFLSEHRPNVSVYDKRTSELLLMTCASQGIFRIINELVKQPDPLYLTGGILASDKLQITLGELVIDFYTRQDIEVGDYALQRIYDNVSKLSVDNEKMKKYVKEASETLEMRKQDAITMNQHKALDDKRKRKARLIFYLWITTLIIVLLVAGILLMKGSYKSLMIHNVVILGIVLLIVLFGYIMSRIR